MEAEGGKSKGRCGGCGQSSGPASAFEGKIGTALGTIDDLMMGT